MRCLPVLAAALPLMSGCLSSGVLPVSRWTIDYRADGKPAASARYGIARVSQVSVRAPYDGDGLSVLLADGSVAADAYNLFAASPSQLLRGTVFDALTASGLFASVVNGSSAVSATVSVELLVTRLALDCRGEGDAGRTARAEIVLRLVDSRGNLLQALPASGAADAADGNYGRAFSAAVSRALEQALARVR
ncbi:MAG: ABC-type transport auxiliary lipoprotein family protein [Kiritimatiellia bacterium]